MMNTTGAKLQQCMQLLMFDIHNLQQILLQWHAAIAAS
jgi:hypothetical protein